MWGELGIAVSILIGFVIALIDSFVLPVYLTFMSLHALFLYISMKTKNILVVIYSIFQFVSYGIGSTFLYLYRSQAERTGFAAIGSFDFSYAQLFSAYSYMFVFFTAFLLFSFLFKKQYHSNSLVTFIRQQYNTIRLRPTLSLFPIIICVLFFCWISIQMYNLHIGMIGLQQTELPFHMTGILFYSRRYLFPIILIWLFVKTKSKTLATVVLIIYSVFMGITATSKSACILVLAPLAFINYLIGKRGMAYVCAFFAAVGYMVISEMRQIVFDFDADIAVWDLLNTSFVIHDDNVVLSFLYRFTNRFFGLRSSILPDQYHGLDFNDLVDFYLGKGLSIIMPDYCLDLFGFSLPGDKAYGVSLGFNGTMALLSCHNYLYSIFQAFIVALIFAIQNDCFQRIVKSRSKNIIKYLAILVLLAGFYSFFGGHSFIIVYVTTFVLLLIRANVRVKE